MKCTFVFILKAILIILSITTNSSLGMVKNTLSRGSSLSVENFNDVLVSPNDVFSAGFYQVGENAYGFAIWFKHAVEKTVVWMANRDAPVNGRLSRLTVMKDGRLNLIDAGRDTVWSSTDKAKGSRRVDSSLELLDTGNLVLKDALNAILWQSFESPTNTLLPNQNLTKEVNVISTRSKANYSSGFYKLYFDNDNVLRLLFDGQEASSIYLPKIEVLSWDAGRTTYNDTKIACFDTVGSFVSSDNLQFNASDYGIGPQRRLTLDFDGNLRMYSLQEDGHWMVTYETLSRQCEVHGLCGPNSLCLYVASSGRKCSCLPGFKLKDPRNWGSGCVPTFYVPNEVKNIGFVGLLHVDFYGYDFTFLGNYTYEKCRNYCLDLPSCKAFLLKYTQGVFNCYPKTRLRNGFQSPDFPGIMYLKVPKGLNTIMSLDDSSEVSKLDCGANGIMTIQLQREYTRRRKGSAFNFLIWFAGGIGIIEVTCILVVSCFLLKTSNNHTEEMQGYAVAGFKKFTFDELKKATLKFSQEIGRGGSGTVYKGRLADGRTAAIKWLRDAKQGEAEFSAEVSTIGRLNHMNLIEMWGFCYEGNQRLLVFEYMQNKSLAESMSVGALKWESRYQIAVGTARGLAYLHEECLEWVLHCDVKPQNILLDTNFRPKLADFGLSKLLNRSGANDSGFSKIRGTRGYMAPEWVTNMQITLKVDVCSYGVVMLEIVTGNSQETSDVVTWVREKRNDSSITESWIKEIADPIMEGNYKNDEVLNLTLIALQSVEEDKDSRPTMSQVVEMLQGHVVNNMDTRYL